jgi:hypothetical protein
VVTRPVIVSAELAGNAPTRYELAPGFDFEVTHVTASFAGGGASGPFLAVLAYYSQEGVLIGRYFPDQVLDAGDTADVSYAPFLGGVKPGAVVIGEEIAYSQRVTNVTLTSTNEAAPNDVVSLGAVVFDGTTVVELVYYAASLVLQVKAGTPSYAGVLNLWDGSTDLGRIAVVQTPIAPSAELAVPVQVSRRLTPSAGTHTYRIRGWVTVAGETGRVDASPPRLPSYLRANRVG